MQALMSRSLENPSVDISDPRAAALFGRPPNDAGISITKERLLEYSPLWQGIKLISGDCKQTDFNIKRLLPTGGKQIDVSHPAHKLMRRTADPKHGIPASEWRRVMMLHSLVFQAAYSLILRDRGGMPMRLVVLDPERTQPKTEGGDWWYENPEISGRISPMDVFHIRGLTWDGFNGMSLIDYARNSVGRALASEKFSNRFFRNDASPTGALTHPETLSDQALDHLRETWTSEHGGVSNAHKPAILEEGMKWQSFGVDAEKAQLIASLEFGVEDAARILNIPSHKLGAKTNTSYKSNEQDELSYLQSTLGPWFKAFEDEGFEKLLTEDEKRAESHEIERNIIRLLSADASVRGEFYNKLLQNGALQPDEVRDFEGLNPLPDSKGKVTFWPQNMTAVGEGAEGEEPEQNEGDDDTPLSIAFQKTIDEVFADASRRAGNLLGQFFERQSPRLAIEEAIGQAETKYRGRVREIFEPASHAVERLFGTDIDLGDRYMDAWVAALRGADGTAAGSIAAICRESIGTQLRDAVFGGTENGNRKTKQLAAS